MGGESSLRLCLRKCLTRFWGSGRQAPGSRRRRFNVLEDGGYAPSVKPRRLVEELHFIMVQCPEAIKPVNGGAKARIK